VELNIHPFQGLLHLLLAAGGRANVVGTQTLIILDTPNMLRRNKSSFEQPVRVQRGLPLTVFHVGFAARQVFDVLAVDHHYLQPGFLQNFVGTKPVDSSSLHRHRTDALAQQVVAQCVQLGRRRAKHLGLPSSYGYMHLFAADINGSRFGIN